MPFPRVVEIKQEHNDPTLDICIDTLAKNKQALVFCNTKKGAESQAERIANAVKTIDAALHALSEEILHVVPSPTKQCRRLALCVKKGIAFHHAGLHAKQRELVENKFREGVIKIICSTPTLAMGLDMPAFRVVIRDLKRFGDGGNMTDIPVLEYHQMAGRAGRPGKESFGEAIILAETDDQKERRTEQYIHGEPEEIFSKLAVEPVLRTYVLSLIAAEFVTSTLGLYDFFERTFYAKQYGDVRKLRSILDRMVICLEEWEFLVVEGSEVANASAAAKGAVAKKESTFKGASLFTNAKELLKKKDGALRATPLGKRVAELYLDPYTGHFLITCLQRATSRQPHDFALLQMLTSCLELRPLLRPRVKELDSIVEKTNPFIPLLLSPEPVQYTGEYEEFLMTLKTALFLNDWIEEVQEDELLEQYGVGPGEVHAKLDRADWLLYAAEELARLLSLHQLRSPLAKLRVRLKHGAKEELLALLQLKNIGRVRARKLYNANVMNLQHVKDVEFSTLATLIGKNIALDLKKQVGIDLSAEHVQVKPNKRKGQTSMGDYGEPSE